MKPEYQKKVAQFAAETGLTADPASRLLDLVSEVGELSKELLKETDYGTRSFEASRKLDQPIGWQDEIGDVFFSLIALANSTGCNLDTALHGSLSKYRERITKSNTLSSSAVKKQH